MYKLRIYSQIDGSEIENHLGPFYSLAETEAAGERFCERHEAEFGQFFEFEAVYDHDAQEASWDHEPIGWDGR